MKKNTLTSSEVNRHYKACLDSVNLINEGCPANMSQTDWEDMKQRNTDHLQIMVDKPFWLKKHDMKPIREAIKA